MVALSSPAFAAPPEVIVFGGGWSAEGTQVSLEIHAQALTRALARSRPTLLFAGPDRKQPVVQVEASRKDPVGALLGIAFERLDLLDVTYRRTLLRPDGPATREELLARLRRTTRKGAPFIAFGIGHGTLPAQGSARLDLWGPPEDALTLDALDRELKVLKPRAPIALVLGQCHSGAFTTLALERPPGQATFCALAAIPGDRESSGCTADANDPGVKAYMALIAEAFTRVAEVDLNADRQVSLSEAHAFARIHDATINVPVTSSDAWLRKAVGATPPGIAGRRIAELLKQARPTERVVLRRLLPAFARTKGSRVGAVENRYNVIDKQLDALDKTLASIEDERRKAQSKLRDAVIGRWPELANPYHRVSRQLLASDAKAVATFIRMRPELKTYRALDRRVAKHAARYSTLARNAARLERWLRAAETTVFEAHLRKKQTKAQQSAFRQILACEALIP